LALYPGNTLSIPGMAESIIEGGKIPIEECVEEIEFWPGK
jgi:hypothetical protein